MPLRRTTIRAGGQCWMVFDERTLNGMSVLAAVACSGRFAAAAEAPYLRLACRFPYPVTSLNDECSNPSVARIPIISSMPSHLTVERRDREWYIARVNLIFEGMGVQHARGQNADQVTRPDVVIVAAHEVPLRLPDGECVLAVEQYFVVNTDTESISRGGWTAEEMQVMADHRWWSREELSSTTETIYPEGLVKLLDEAGVFGADRPL
jgi:hypothetical protein